MKASIIITYHNEGNDFINRTIHQVANTADIDEFEIIVVDDHSDVPIINKDARIIRQERRQGVGAAYDTAVKTAKYDTLILMTADIRLSNNGWLKKMVEASIANPKSTICTHCLAVDDDYGYNPDGSDNTSNVKSGGGMGAGLVLKLSYKNNPNRNTILMPSWIIPDGTETGLTEGPTVLGAVYSIQKEWFEYIDGFAGHKIWGTLDRMISIKSYKFGGNCLCHRDVKTGHIFKKSIHNIAPKYIHHNKAWVAHTLFEDETARDLVKHMPRTKEVLDGRGMIDGMAVRKKQEEYSKKFVMDDKTLLHRMKAEIVER